ncbi:hypothetical protein M011DRAFT_464290 [Sporormia fimetaria CBS 119925]|uniref:Uncharacterized protein n=1 Tax=Sporormia fimetaria CBS 119925 TaxID=1340428 RepID=A0A6A6VN42_9PLEO|nr:hypothetical protein M011DRAFT_464290 [Sporormia fimetaria CBS 119925]
MQDEVDALKAEFRNMIAKAAAASCKWNWSSWALHVGIGGLWAYSNHSSTGLHQYHGIFN